MVRKRSENGGYYHEPPYTWEEEMALYKMADYGDGPITILHAAPKPPKPKDDDKSK